MSVDTNTKGKDLSPYQRLRSGEVEVLVAPRLSRYATAIRLDARRGVLGRRLTMEHDHRHGPACRH